MENLKHTLRKGAIAGLAALTLAGCGDNYDAYRYDGMIDGEQVKMYRNIDQDILEVKREDGTTVRYVDVSSNSSPNSVNDVTYVVINKNMVEKQYIKDKVGAEAIKEAQNQFNVYLSKILEKKQQEFESKQQEAMEAIKKQK